LSRKYVVLLTGIGGNTAQGVARPLMKFRDEFTIVGTDCDRYNVLFGRRYAKKVYLVPRASSPDYISTLTKIVAREGVDVVIPSPDPEVLAITKHRHEIHASTLLPSLRAVEIAQDKWLTYRQLEGKVGQPKTYLARSREDVEEAFRELGSPIWVRRKRGAGGSRSFLAHTPQQADFWISYWRGYDEFLLSEYLNSRNLSWIGLYRDGELIASGGHLRLKYFMKHTSPTGVTGNINVGVTTQDDKVNSIAERAVEAIDSRVSRVYTADLEAKFTNGVVLAILLH